jgi:hypothetical protein
MLGMEVPEGHELSFWRDKLTEFVSFWTTPGICLVLTGSIDTMVGNVIDRLQWLPFAVTWCSGRRFGARGAPLTTVKKVLTGLAIGRYGWRRPRRVHMLAM